MTQAERLAVTILALIGIAVSISLFADTFKESYTADYNFSQTSSATFPRVVLALWFAGSCALLAGRPVDADGGAGRASLRRLVALGGVFVSSLLAILVLGFIAGGIFAFAAIGWMLGFRRLAPLVAMSIGAVGAIWLAFGQIASVPLPPGLIGG